MNTQHAPTKVMTVALAFITFNATAVIIKHVDKKVRTENIEYAISIAAEDGELGHAFVVWNYGDAKSSMTMQKVVGFYPQSDKKTYKALFGLSPGQIFDDSSEKPEIKIVISLNSEGYNKANHVFEKWKDSKNYLLGFSDCTSFVAEIGSAIGLNMPNRLIAPYPIDYVKKIGDLN